MEQTGVDARRGHRARGCASRVRWRGNLVPEPFPFAGNLAGSGFVVAAPGIYAQLFELLSRPPDES